MKKRIVSTFMCLAMLLSMMSVSAFAADVDDIQTVKTAIEAGTYTLEQATAGSSDVVKTALVSLVNEEITGSGISSVTEVAEANITVSNFTAAVAGTEAAPAGTDGSFDFTVSLTLNSETATATVTDNEITATEYVNAGQTDAEKLAAVKTAIEAGTYTLEQTAAGSSDAVKTALVSLVNEEITGSGVSDVTEVAAANITVSNFTAAVAGTEAAPTGTDGSFDFTVSLTLNAATATATVTDNEITATAYTSTPAESVDITGSTDDGTYSGTVSSVDSSAISGATGGLVTFAPTTNADAGADTVNVTLSSGAVDALVEGDVGASIQTSAGGIELSKDVLESITTGATSSAVVVTIDKVDTTSAGEAFNKAGNDDSKLKVYDITVKVDGTAVTDLGGDVTLKMAADSNAAYLIYAKPATGGKFTYEQVSGAEFDGGFVTWTSNHLSTYGTTDKAGAKAFISVDLGSSVAASPSIGPKVTVNDITSGNYVTVQVVSADKVVALWSIAATGTSYDFYVPAGAIVTVWETAETLAFGANGVITNTPVGTLDLTATVGGGE